MNASTLAGVSVSEADGAQMVIDYVDQTSHPARYNRSGEFPRYSPNPSRARSRIQLPVAPSFSRRHRTRRMCAKGHDPRGGRIPCSECRARAYLIRERSSKPASGLTLLMKRLLKNPVLTSGIEAIAEGFQTVSLQTEIGSINGRVELDNATRLNDGE